MKSNRPGLNIPFKSLDELLGADDTAGVTELPATDIHPFSNHPFKVSDDKRMEELIQSVRENGVMTPILVRPDPKGGYGRQSQRCNSVHAPMSGDELISALRNRTDQYGGHDAVFFDALNQILHSLVITDLKRMIRKRMYVGHWKLGDAVSIFSSQQFIKAFEGDIQTGTITFHCQGPPLPVPHMQQTPYAAVHNDIY